MSRPRAATLRRGREEKREEERGEESGGGGGGMNDRMTDQYDCILYATQETDEIPGKEK